MISRLRSHLRDYDYGGQESYAAPGCCKSQCPASQVHPFKKEHKKMNMMKSVLTALTVVLSGATLQAAPVPGNFAEAWTVSRLIPRSR